MIMYGVLEMLHGTPCPSTWKQLAFLIALHADHPAAIE